MDIFGYIMLGLFCIVNVAYFLMNFRKAVYALGYKAGQAAEVEKLVTEKEKLSKDCQRILEMNKKLDERAALLNERKAAMDYRDRMMHHHEGNLIALTKTLDYEFGNYKSKLN